MLLILALAMSLASPSDPKNTAGSTQEAAGEPTILSFETGWIRHMDAAAEDGSRTCHADGEGASFEKLAHDSCTPGSGAASEAQRRKPHRVGMEAITAITLAGDEPSRPPRLTFRELHVQEIELRVAPDGSVSSCRSVRGADQDLCALFRSGEIRLMPFAGSAEREGRLVRSSGLCFALDRGSCGREDRSPEAP